MGIRSSEDGNPILEKSCSEGRMKLASVRASKRRRFCHTSLSSTKSRAEGSKTFGFEEYFPKTGPHVVPLLVKTSLSFLNEKSVSNQEPEYELVDAIGAYRGIFPICYHLNFTARPKNESGAEGVKLFFAEIGKVEREDKKYDLNCRIFCELGPSDTKTGRFGCKICDRSPHPIQHPESGFRKSPIFPDPMKKKRNLNNDVSAQV